MSRNPVLKDKMDNSQHAQPHRYELTHTPDTHVHPVYQFFTRFPKYPIPIFKALTHFESNHLGQTKVNQSNQGWLSYHVFAVKQYAIYKTGIGLCL
jgi:hypothetical protein